MTRAFLIVLDSLGIGGAPDAEEYFNGDLPDTGANTLAHIAAACVQGQADEGREGPLHLPHLTALGLGAAASLASGVRPRGLDAPVIGLWGAATAHSKGKDTPSGHWELAGVPVPWDWHVFPKRTPAFPKALTDQVCAAAQTSAILGNTHGSGTDIIARLGAEHIRTGYPICYTSADSVFQIAAHEAHFGLSRLYALCETLAPSLHAMKVGRVIARPFIGDAKSGFSRTKNRRDYAIPPPAPVLTNWVQDAGASVYGLGKIGDIFCMQGLSTVETGEDAHLMTQLHARTESATQGSLIFANFVEFDSLYGHRRDVAGYARHLEWFDRELGQILTKLRLGDMLLITADHGNDPTWSGTDHTRERVPVLIAGHGQGSLGHLVFTDIAALIASHLGIRPIGPAAHSDAPRFLSDKNTEGCASQ